MADFTNSKPIQDGAVYQANAIETVLGRLEPLLTPEQLKSRFLKGIPLTLRIKDPDTGKPYRIMDEELKDYIQLAVDEAEAETGITIMPTKFSQILPYQRQDFQQFGYLQLPHRPIFSFDQLTVRLADNSDVFIFPNEWISTANLIHGQLNILPLAFQGVEGGTGIIGGIATGSGNAVFFNSLWNRDWVAALFGTEYSAGFPNGMLPKVVNQLIGDIATIRVLSMIAATYWNTSSSLGIDGMSQSTSTPGYQRFTIRMQELADHRKLLVRKIRKFFGTSFVVGTI